MKRTAVLLLAFGLALPLLAQDSGAQGGAPFPGRQQGRGGMGDLRGGRGVGGTITDIKADTLTLKTPAGNSVTVKLSNQTQ